MATAVNPLTPCRVPGRYAVKPADVARPPADRAVFVAALSDELTGGIVQYRRHWPFSHTCDVGLEHADDALDLCWPNPSADRPLSRHRRRGGGVRIGAEIRVEKSPLGTFEEDVVSPPDRLVNQHSGILDMRRQTLGIAEVLPVDLVE